MELDAGWASSHLWTAGALCADRLSQITWMARPGSVCRSISVEEVPEVHRPVLGGQAADHLAGGGVQRGEQVDGAVPDVVVAAPLGHPGDHRQHRRGPLQRLDLRLLIDREDRRVRRRRQVQADHVADLVDEQRVRGDLEVLGPPGLQPERPPDPVHVSARSPTCRASSRLDQCVAPSGASSRVRTTTSSTWASVIVRGTPGRGSSLSPSSRRARNRFRHLLTVLPADAQPAATAILVFPSAQASTIRARSASPCAVLRRFAHSPASAARPPTAPAAPACYHPYPQQTADHGRSHHQPGLKRETTHVVKSEFKTGTLVQRGQEETVGRLYLWAKHPAIAGGSVYHIHAVSSRPVSPVSPPGRAGPCCCYRFCYSIQNAKALSRPGKDLDLRA